MPANITPAHRQSESNKYVVYFPDHEPREGDPHYAAFNAMRRRMVAAGNCHCWICGTTENLEWHHEEIEYALANGEDWTLVAKDFPDANIASEEDLLNFVESEGNMRILCADHHRSPFCGIHHTDYPNWKAQKYWRRDLPPILSPAGSVTITKTTETTVTVEAAPASAEASAPVSRETTGT